MEPWNLKHGGMGPHVGLNMEHVSCSGAFVLATFKSMHHRTDSAAPLSSAQRQGRAAGGALAALAGSFGPRGAQGTGPLRAVEPGWNRAGVVEVVTLQVFFPLFAWPGCRGQIHAKSRSGWDFNQGGQGIAQLSCGRSNLANYIHRELRDL